MPLQGYDVIICGYGPSGVVAANLLGQRGAKVLVVERQPDVIDIPRAVHFDGEVMRIFQSLGLARSVQAISFPAGGLRFINARGQTLIRAEPAKDKLRHAWPRGHYFSQPELERTLRDNVRQFKGVDVWLGREVVDFEQDHSGVRATVRTTSDQRTEPVRASYLLACDGGSSTLRSRLGVKMRTLGPPSTWLVCDTLLDHDIGGGKPMFQICNPSRPGTIEPCSGRQVRWEFRTRSSDSIEQLESESFSRSLMQPYLHLVDPALESTQFKVLRSKVYTFQSAVASRWRHGRVFLLGDAAHLTPPFLGQGMCAGIRDAFNLAWKLHGVLGGEYTPSLLDTYESERRLHVTAAIRDAADIAQVIQMENPAMVWLRDAFFKMRRRLSRLGNLMEAEASWSLGPGLFDRHGTRAAARDRHNLFDQAIVRTVDGERQRIDDLIGTNFALLLFGNGPLQAFFMSSVTAWTELGTRILVILAPDGTLSDAVNDRMAVVTVVTDVDETLARWRHRVGGVDIAVVRPDRQVFGRYRGSPKQLSKMLGMAHGRLAGGLGYHYERSSA